MQSVGSYLRGVREERKIPIAQVARDTKIGQRYLEAIEEDEFSLLPAPAYARGFIRIYAEYLGVDPQPCIDFFLEQYVGSSKQAFSLESNALATNLASTSWRYTALGIAAVVLVAVVIMASLALWRSCAGPRLEETLIMTEELETMPIPPIPVVPTAVEPVVEEIPAEPIEENKMKLVARTRREDVWIKVLADDVLLFEGIIPQGKEEFWIAEQKLHLRLGKPGAVELLLNGEPVEDPTSKKAQNLIIEKGGKVTWYKGRMREQ